MDRSPELIDADGAAEFVALARRGFSCWRGLSIANREPSVWHGVLETHPRRRPRSMELDLSEACDEWFEQHFGWRARSNHSLFVSGSGERAEQFGIPVIVIPVAPALLEAGDYRDDDLESPI